MAAETKMSSGTLTNGDAAILRFLAAAEIIETDLWLQHWELGGVQNNEFATPTGGNSLYIQALKILDGDMDQYVTDNTDDEISHELLSMPISLKRRAHGEPRSLPDFAGQSGNRRQQVSATSHQSHAAQCGHQLLDSLSH
jgi:hypothetical protein